MVKEQTAYIHKNPPSSLDYSTRISEIFLDLFRDHSRMSVLYFWGVLDGPFGVEGCYKVDQVSLKFPHQFSMLDTLLRTR